MFVLEIISVNIHQFIIFVWVEDILEITVKFHLTQYFMSLHYSYTVDFFVWVKSLARIHLQEEEKSHARLASWVQQNY